MGEEQTIVDQLEVAINGLKKLKEIGQPGEKGRAVAIALTHVETAILWLLTTKD